MTAIAHSTLHERPHLMTATSAPAPERRQKRATGVPIPPRDVRALRNATTRIRDAEALWDERAERMSYLWEHGSSLDAIAAAAGLTREAVRRSVIRWRDRTNWSGQAQ